MNWEKHYQAPDNAPWEGRSDLPENACFFQIIQLLDLENDLPKADKTPSFALLGFCSDEGVRRNFGRPGAAEGPAHIRTALAKLPVQRDFSIYDAGDIICRDQDLETAQQALAEAVSRLLSCHITPIILGGGHELAWGHYQGIAKAFPDEALGIINFDAHYDMRPLTDANRGSSGTPFLQIAKACEQAGHPLDYTCIGIQPAGNLKTLFETAKKYKVKTVFADQLHQQQTDTTERFIQECLQKNKHVYLSICLDVFAAPYAPGVSAPQALGLTPWQVLPYIQLLAQSGKILSYDIAELSPAFDKDERTARLAANCIFVITHQHREAV